MGKRRANRVLLRRPEGKKKLEDMRRVDGITKMDLEEVAWWEHGLD
jgi:hypothetical protein